MSNADEAGAQPAVSFPIVSAVEPVAPAVIGDVRLPEPSRAYVQAGAFSQPANVEKARIQLARLGPVDVTNIGSSGRDLWRVRLGPLASPGEAERLAVAVLRSGYPGSHVVVE
jgi:rare lipoprotein A